MSAGAAAMAAAWWRAAAALARVEAADTAIGATASDAVFRRDKLTLRRYRPRAAAHPQAPPLIVAHGLIGRASMIDLDPERSLARDLLDQGVDLYLVDWGAMGRADNFLSVADCVDDLLAGCVAHVRESTGRAPAVMGVCEGGVFSACLAARAPQALSGLALAVTPIDFHAEPDALLSRWIRACDGEALAAFVEALGGMPGSVMGSVFEALAPARSQRKYTHDLLGIADDPEALRGFLRMERWIADRPHHPAEAAKQMLIDCYRDNLLAQGRLKLEGSVVDLGAIAAPVLSICGLRDHLVPPACAMAIGPLLAASTRFETLALDTGHIGVFVSRRGREALGAALLDWLASL